MLMFEKYHNLTSSEGFIFIYLTMYDSNLLNIRNNLIHGRNYLKGAGLEVAFRCTMLCLEICNKYLEI